MEEKFTDGISQIHYLGNMVRIDFVSLQPTNDEKKTNQINVSRMIMTPQAFLNMFSSMQQLVDGLVEKGVFGKQDK